MKYLSSFSIIILLLLHGGCKDSGTVVQGPVNGNTKYPDKLNNEWEYQTTIVNSYYNQSGGFDSTSYDYSDNSIIKIIKTDDSLKTYRGLIKFKTYDKLDPENVSYDWYLNSDTSFIAIAYYNPGAQVIQPKSNFGKRYLTLADIKRMLYSLSPDLLRSQRTVLDDTIQYYEIPRKVFAYPLNIGNSWVELYYPFYRERYVNDYLNIEVEGQTYKCYEVKVIWTDWDIEFNDYISLNAGLVKREIIADSVMIANEYGDPIGFGKTDITTVLTRRNF